MTASLQRAPMNQTNYQQIFEAIGDSVLVIDGDGYIAFTNNRVKSLLNFSPGEMIGQHYEKFVAALWRDHIRTVYARILRYHESTIVTEVPMLNRAGDEVWVEQMVAPLRDDNGAVHGITAVMRDLTGRNMAEAELEKHLKELGILRRIDAELSHQLDVGYVLSMALDAAVRLSLADAGGIELLKQGELYTGTIIGNYPGEFINNYPKPPCGIIKRVLANREAELILDVSQDEDYVPYIPTTKALMTIPLLSQDRLMGVLFLETRRPERFSEEVYQFILIIATRIAVAVDNAQLFTTTLQQLAELQDLYLQISQLEQLKTDMIRIAAHDLGNPLTSISGYIELLIESGLEDRYHEYALIIRESGMRMKKIIRDILSLQRIEELAQGDINDEIDLHDLVCEVYESQRYPANHKGQILRLEATNQKMIIYGDTAQLREALTNLISNAIKYTPNGGEITIYLCEEEDHYIFEVVDNGYGIPDDQQERLFQPFYRAKSQETQQIEGTGLGLHLVQNIIERHKGRMRFQSVYGEGSTFGFSFRVPMP